MVAGWSSFAEGPVAVVWRFDGERWRPRRLPQPGGTTTCQADAIDLPRIAGICVGPGLRDGVGMVWRSDDLERWDVEALLLRDDYSYVSVTGLREDLVVGVLDREGSFTDSPPVAWRLPPD